MISSMRPTKQSPNQRWKALAGSFDGQVSSPTNKNGVLRRIKSRVESLKKKMYQRIPYIDAVYNRMKIIAVIEC